VFVLVSPSTIYPGQEFNLIWAVCAGPGEPPPQRQTVTLTLDNHSVFRLDDSDEDQPGGSRSPATMGTLHVDRARLERAGLLPEFYRGSTARTAGIRARSGTSSLSGTSQFHVSGSVAAPAILFTAPPAASAFPHYPGDVRAALWKEPYTCVIDVQNRALTDVVFALTLREAENTRDALGAATDVLATALVPLETQTATLRPNEHQMVSFSPITKQWVWLTAAIWTATGPTLRGFTYDVAVTATDELGNLLGGALSPQIRVEVSVSSEKINFQIAAIALSITAAVLAIAGAFWPPLEGAGAVAYAGATAFGASALDPPVPDPDFKTPAPWQLPAWLAYLDNHPAKALAAWLRAVIELAARRQRMYAVEAKVLGALQGKDPVAEKMQVEDYTAELHELVRLYQDMVANLNAAAVEVRDHGATAEALADMLADAQQRAVSGAWRLPGAEPFEQAGVETTGLTEVVARLGLGDLDVRKALGAVTQAAGRSAKLTAEDAVRRYALIRPEYFGGK
jgi:hypothetical protein